MRHFLTGSFRIGVRSRLPFGHCGFFRVLICIGASQTFIRLGLGQSSFKLRRFARRLGHSGFRLVYSGFGRVCLGGLRFGARFCLRHSALACNRFSGRVFGPGLSRDKISEIIGTGGFFG